MQPIAYDAARVLATQFDHVRVIGSVPRVTLSLVECDNELMVNRLFVNEPDGCNRQVQACVDASKPDQRQIGVHGTPKCHVFCMIGISASPLVAQITVRPLFVVIRPPVWIGREDGPNTECSIQLPRLAYASLRVHEGDSLAVDSEIGDVLSPHEVTGALLNHTQVREGRCPHPLVELGASCHWTPVRTLVPNVVPENYVSMKGEAAHRSRDVRRISGVPTTEAEFSPMESSTAIGVWPCGGR